LTFEILVCYFLQAEMDDLMERMKVERDIYEKAQEEKKLITERRMMAAAVHIQTLFRGYWYDRFTNWCHAILILIVLIIVSVNVSVSD